MKITYDPYARTAGRGKHVATPIAPYRVFANRTATCVEDTEYLIHVEDMTMGWIRRNFPDKAKACWRLRGIHTGDHTSSRDRDYIREGDGQPVQRIVSAQNVNGHITAPQYARGNSQHLEQDNDDTVEVGEYWLRDDSLESYERQKIVNGVKQTQPMVGPDGLYALFEQIGTRPAVSEIDGAPFLMPIMQPKQEPVMETCWRCQVPRTVASSINRNRPWRSANATFRTHTRPTASRGPCGKITMSARFGARVSRSRSKTALSRATRFSPRFSTFWRRSDRRRTC